MPSKSVEMCLSHAEHAHQAISHCTMFNVHSRTAVVVAVMAMMPLSLEVSMT
jgi:hypothetical protein